MKYGISLFLLAVVCSSGCGHIPAGNPTACEKPPIEGLVEYDHLLKLQFALAPEGDLDAPCEPILSSLYLSAIDEHPARYCLPGLDRMLATYDRSCRANDAWREE